MVVNGFTEVITYLQLPTRPFESAFWAPNLKAKFVEVVHAAAPVVPGLRIFQGLADSKPHLAFLKTLTLSSQKASEVFEGLSQKALVTFEPFLSGTPAQSSANFRPPPQPFLQPQHPPTQPLNSGQPHPPKM